MGFLAKRQTQDLMKPRGVQTTLTPEQIFETVRKYVGAVAPTGKYKMQFKLYGKPGSWLVRYGGYQPKDPNEFRYQWTYQGTSIVAGGRTSLTLALIGGNTKEGRLIERDAFFVFRDSIAGLLRDQDPGLIVRTDS